VAEDPHPGNWTWRLLAGLEAGIVAGMVLAASLWVQNLLFARSAWQLPHLFASVLLGRAAIYPRFGANTLIGYALLFLLSGGQGLLFAVLVPPRLPAIWRANLGIAFSLACYVLFLGKLLGMGRGVVPAGALLLGYFLFGASLALHGRYYRQMSRPLTVRRSGTAW
jgi:hypothetical protein